ncbi:hypothetical protein BX616_006407 [Lobosporangium transversale]|uniref:Pentacotripeptide-repeat region of PRORP domain-containing protein n=1 Tax=Lobosporangium transversale TaxID=64571 RepID=A0A1Y2GBT0_9FUNG|nr:hypothetical protein BCR41DRAFT_425087 [Lobosporangium transversale]KAF9915321.1 hypothetical protein BX616_006407 [Lobosporangium transversale]ORZ06553.1 hypothetical protein BCR41DRAFT_425087 [Lobosporangium transversale]|eukprot:XP_021877596.1 hypothetical protein BCR41DRAFT_425087 [Lobosporangium transversale]
MRTAAITRILTAQRLSTAFRIDQTVATKTPENFWQSCFQRAYTRFAAAIQEQKTHSLKARCSSLLSLSLCTDHLSCPTWHRLKKIQRYDRHLTSAAATIPNSGLTQPTLNEPALAHTTSTKGSLTGIGTSKKPFTRHERSHRSIRGLMYKLSQALRCEDLDAALRFYLLIRKEIFSRRLGQPLFRCQCRLVELIHSSRLEMLESGNNQSHTRLSARYDRQRHMVLKDISMGMLKTGDRANAMASLVDALGKSKAMVKHSYKAKSSTKLQDWREALRALEDWARKNPTAHGVAAASEVTDSPIFTTVSPSPPPLVSSFYLGNKALEQDLSAWLSKIMKRLVYSHTYLIRSMLDTIPRQFGIQATVEMHVALLDYYSTLGQDGYIDTLAIIDRMNQKGIKWKQEPVIYEYLLYSLSHNPNNIDSDIDLIIEQMLANNLVPREKTMKALMLSAAHSGDLERCLRHIQQMHQEWGLAVSERMKAILLYGCAKRGDFEGAIELLEQLNNSGKLDHALLEKSLIEPGDDGKPCPSSPNPPKPSSLKHSYPSTFLTTKVETLLEEQNVINSSNLLLALINQSRAQRGNKKRLSQASIKEEASRVLELFTLITKNPQRADTRLYTIMMHYLSTLPSPIPGMMYLYKEMLMSKNTKPNHVTYHIMLEACAEQMDIDCAKQLWNDMSASNIIKDCNIRASYIKCMGQTGDLASAEWFTREGLLKQQELDKVRLRHQTAFILSKREEPKQGLPLLLEPPLLPRREHFQEAISLSTLHELMKAHRAHSRPERVYELYCEIERGEWGYKIRPNELTLSILLGACASDAATADLVDRGIAIVEDFRGSRRRQHLLQPERLDGKDGDNGDKASQLVNGTVTLDDDSEYPSLYEALGMQAGSKSGLIPVLSDFSYQLYYTMLGRHHRQRKIVEVWDDMMQSIERPPSRLTVNIVIEALEQVQWGAAPIKRIRRQLREHWSKTGCARQDESSSFDFDEPNGDESVGAGGRFWR